MDRRTDTQLLHAARRDPDAFGEFYDRHARRMLAWLRSETADPEVASELVAEVFATALVAVHRFRGVHERSATAWLRTIAERLLIRHRATGRLEATARNRLAISVPPPEDPFDGVDALLEREAVSTSITEAIRRIPKRQADAVRLRIVEELGYDEIAVALSCSPAAARLRVSRGLQALRAQQTGGSW